MLADVTLIVVRTPTILVISYLAQKSFLPLDWDFVQSPKITDIDDLRSQWKSQFFREVRQFILVRYSTPLRKNYPPHVHQHIP